MRNGTNLCAYGFDLAIQIFAKSKAKPPKTGIKLTKVSQRAFQQYDL